MSHQLHPQNEFFIYVPSLQLDERPSHETDGDEKPKLSIENTHLPARLRTWKRIPLAGKVSVYINPDQEQEEIACIL